MAIDQNNPFADLPDTQNDPFADLPDASPTLQDFNVWARGGNQQKKHINSAFEGLDSSSPHDVVAASRKAKVDPNYLRQMMPKIDPYLGSDSKSGMGMGDFQNLILSGAMSANKMVVDTASYLGNKVHPQASETLGLDSASQFFQRGLDAAEDLRSDRLKAEMSRPIYHEGTDDWQMPSAIQATGIMAETAPMMPMFGGVGGAVTKGLQTAGLGTKAATITGYGSTNAAFIGGDTYREAKDEITNDLSKKIGADDFNGVPSANAPNASEQEIDLIAEDYAQNAGNNMLIPGFISGAVGLGVPAIQAVSKPMTGARARLGNAGLGGVTEGGTEFLEEAGQGVAVNNARIDSGNNQVNLYDGVIDRGAKGLVGGVASGAAFGMMNDQAAWQKGAKQKINELEETDLTQSAVSENADIPDPFADIGPAQDQAATGNEVEIIPGETAGDTQPNWQFGQNDMPYRGQVTPYTYTGEYEQYREPPRSVPVGQVLEAPIIDGEFERPRGLPDRSDVIIGEDGRPMQQAQEFADGVADASNRALPFRDVIYGEDNRNVQVKRNGKPFGGRKAAQITKEFRQAKEQGLNPQVIKVNGGYGWVADGEQQAPTPEVTPQNVQPTITTKSAQKREAPKKSTRSKVYTPNGRELEVEYAIVDADQLVTSNTDDGRVNPDYPQTLQPRDRTRASSEIQINSIANNLNPALLGESATTGDGAPIISDSGIVESGNGRSLALKRAYQNGKADKYRSALIEQGYDVSGFEKPVLARIRRTQMNDQDLVDYTKESNERSTLSLSASETAKADGNAISNIISDFKGGDVSAAGNRDFVRKFMQGAVSQSEQASMIDSQGMLSQDGRRRIEAAMIANAYENTELVNDLFESSDNDIKSIGGALLDASGDWAKMRAAKKAGATQEDVDITPNVIDAVNLVRRSRAEGKKLSEMVSQTDIFAGDIDPTTKVVLGLFYGGDNFTKPRSRQRVKEALTRYAELASSTNGGDDLFGGELETVKPEQLLGQANAINEQTDQQAEAQTSLLDQNPEPAGQSSAGDRGEGQRPTASENGQAGTGSQVSNVSPINPEKQNSEDGFITDEMQRKQNETFRKGLLSRIKYLKNDTALDKVVQYAKQDKTTSVDFIREVESAANARKIELAANEAATSPTNNLPEPTEAQKEAGNYKKGKVRLHGLDISIENPKGSTRKGKDQDGKEWSSEMKHHYGDIKGTTGADGDSIDVFIGDNQGSQKVFIVDQIDPKTGEFDEVKVMMGFDDANSAKSGYLSNYDKNWKGLGEITEASVEDFKAWTKRPRKSKQPFALPVKPKNDNGDVALFSIAGTSTGNTSTRTVSRSNANEIVGRFLKGLSSVGKNYVSVVSSYDDLPSEIKDAAKAQGVEYQVKGVFHKGKVHVVLDQHTSALDMETTLFHEAYGHLGIKNLFGNDITKKLNSLFVANGGLKGLRETAKRHGIKLDKYINGLDKTNMPQEMKNRVLMDELLAHMQQSNKPTVKRLAKEVVGFIRQKLRDLGLAKLAKVSDSDLFYVLKQARAAANSGPTQSPGETLFRTNDDAATFSAPIEKRWSKDWFKRKLQDKFAPIADMQASIENATGQELPENQNAYRAEELFYGKTENDLNKIEENHIKPLVDAMTRNNIESGELDQYLMAKHAEERNAYIASINPELQDGGSGMTNAEAREILSRYEQEGKLRGLSAAAKEVYKITKKRKDLIRNSGLEEESLLDVWDANYEFYVPLKGFAEDSEGSTIAKTGSGFDIRGKESMRAMGRRTMAESPTAHAIQDLSATIIRTRKNDVAKTFLNMVESNPNPDIWEVFTEDNPDTERRIVNGEVKENQPIDMRSRKDDYFAVKVDGKAKYIKLKDKDGLLMNAMKNMGPEQMGTFTKGMSEVTRWLSMVNTSLNPEFTVTNFTRDIQTALFNALAEQDLTDGKVKDKAVAMKMIKGSGKAVKSLWQHSAGKLDESDLMYKWIDDFLNDGAKTGYFDSKEVDKIGTDLADLLDMANGTNKGKLLKAKNKIGDFIEGVNGGIENGVRLSAYIEARKAGVPRAKAASFAKNLTVNFNRKGEIGTFLNSLYMFFNAAVQGNVNFARAIATPKVNEATGKKSLNMAQKVAAGITISSFGWAALMREMAGDDEDDVPYWDKIPKGVRERNFIIPKTLWGGEPGEYLKIPLPYGYNIFYNMGDAAEAAINSNTRKAGDLVAEMALSVYASFVPLGSPVGDNGAESVALVAAPTITKPIVELATNKNFFGGPIYRENNHYGSELRDSKMSMRSTGEAYKWMAGFMNDVVGDGRNYKVNGDNPWYDVSPDSIEHLVEFSLGGLYRFGSRIYDNVATKANGGDLSLTDTPFTRQLNGKVQPYADITKFYEARQQLKNIEAEMQSLRGKERLEFRKEYGGKLRLQSSMSALDKRMKSLRKQRDRVEIDKSLSFVEREKKLQSLEDKMKTTAAQFNKRWNEVD